MIKSFKAIKMIGISAVLIMVCSCTHAGRKAVDQRLRPGNIEVNVSEQFRPLTINTIAILPLRAASDKLDLDIETIKKLDRDLIRAFSNNTSFEVLPVTNSTSSYGLLAIAREVAKSHDTQGVIFGSVYHYQQDVKNEYSEAKVDFTLSLYDKTSDSVVWSARYKDRFVPLSDNLLQLPRALSNKFKASTSSELAIEGFSRVTKELESRRGTDLQHTGN